MHYESWEKFLSVERDKEYFKTLMENLNEQYSKFTVYPPKELIFNAFNSCELTNVKAVILGQDVYHGPGQAMGLSFSVPHGVTIPPSLRNIYRELRSDVGFEPPAHGNLTDWAKQGVLLLNSFLTVREGEPGSHADLGWKTFLNAVLAQLNGIDKPVAHLIWGAHAKKASESITNGKHMKLYAQHPSPLSARGFFGCRHFSKANQFLIDNGETPIDWQI